MFEQDYLVRLFAQLIQGVRKALARARDDRDPYDAALLLEGLVEQATNYDSKLLLSLSPESMAYLLSSSNIDARVISFVIHTLMLEASYLKDAHEDKVASLRIQQAQALSQYFSQQEDYESIDLENIENDINSYLDAFNVDEGNVLGQ